MVGILDTFMDVALRAVVDLDARMAGAIRFGRLHHAALAEAWPAGIGVVREDPVVTEIVRHYLLDENAIKSFNLHWEYRYDQSIEDKRAARADIVLTDRGDNETHLWHFIEAKWWWWGNDYQRIQADVTKLTKQLQQQGEPARGHLLIITTADSSDQWRCDDKPDSAAIVHDLHKDARMAALWDAKLAAPAVRIFETEVANEMRVGALLLLPVVGRG